MVFGDIDLSSNSIRTIHGENQNPGAVGWPTVSILTYSFFHTVTKDTRELINSNLLILKGTGITARNA